MTTKAFTVSQPPTKEANPASSPRLQMRQVSSASLIIFTMSSAWMLVGSGTVVTPAFEDATLMYVAHLILFNIRILHLLVKKSTAN